MVVDRRYPQGPSPAAQGLIWNCPHAVGARLLEGGGSGRMKVGQDTIDGLPAMSIGNISSSGPCPCSYCGPGVCVWVLRSFCVRL